MPPLDSRPSRAHVGGEREEALSLQVPSSAKSRGIIAAAATRVLNVSRCRSSPEELVRLGLKLLKSFPRVYFNVTLFSCDIRRKGNTIHHLL